MEAAEPRFEMPITKVESNESYPKLTLINSRLMSESEIIIQPWPLGLVTTYLLLSDMTEEEMMDLALRLSEQEAAVAAALRLRREEEDMRKAIQESVSTEELLFFLINVTVKTWQL